MTKLKYVQNLMLDFKFMSPKSYIGIFLVVFFVGFLNNANAESHFKKVMYIIFENESFSSVLKNPYFKNLTKQGALLGEMYAEEHPSQGNYVAMVAGTHPNLKSDSVFDFDEHHIVDLLEARGMSWKVYAEDYPDEFSGSKQCFLGSRNNLYVRKHNPFVSFKNIQNNPERCKNIVKITDVTKDAQTSGAGPQYAFMIPNLDHDGHDTDLNTAGEYLDSVLKRLAEPEFETFMKDRLLIVTFDEGNWIGSNQIYTLLLGESIKKGSVSKKQYNHISLMSMIEDEFGLASLGLEDAADESAGLNSDPSVWLF